MVILYSYVKLPEGKLVAGIPIPLKNDGLRQLGYEYSHRYLVGAISPSWKMMEFVNGKDYPITPYMKPY